MTRDEPADVMGVEETPVVSLRNVSLRYGKRLALDAINLDLPAGKIVGLIGPDGVGKSSLFSLISGARAIREGRIHVLGGDMTEARHRLAVCPRVAYMPQGLGKNLYPTLSVFENIDFFGRLFGHGGAERARRIAACFDEASGQGQRRVLVGRETRGERAFRLEVTGLLPVILELGFEVRRGLCGRGGAEEHHGEGAEEHGLSVTAARGVRASRSGRRPGTARRRPPT